jgi:hypothetical protein
MTITASTTNPATEIQWYWMTGHGWITRHDGRVFDLRWSRNTTADTPKGIETKA